MRLAVQIVGTLLDSSSEIAATGIGM